MSFYPPKISDKFHSAKKIGAADGANGIGKSAAFVCGAVLRISLQIDGETEAIRQARYKTSGCGYLIAAAETLAEKITGRKLTDPQCLDQKKLQSEIESEIGKFSERRRHCLKLATDALHDAFADFRRSRVEEWTGEKALICTCFGVSEETIENLINRHSLATVEDVTELCSAGGGCGSCQPLIQEIIDSVARETI